MYTQRQGWFLSRTLYTRGHICIHLSMEVAPPPPRTCPRSEVKWFRSIRNINLWGTTSNVIMTFKFCCKNLSKHERYAPPFIVLLCKTKNIPLYLHFLDQIGHISSFANVCYLILLPQPIMLQHTFHTWHKPYYSIWSRGRDSVVTLADLNVFTVRVKDDRWVRSEQSTGVF